jgi:hypothetical protein
MARLKAGGPKADRAGRDLAATAIVAAAYFAYLTFCADFPAVFGKPVAATTRIPWGMVGGVAVVVLVMAAAVAYMALRRDDETLGGETLGDEALGNEILGDGAGGE